MRVAARAGERLAAIETCMNVCRHAGGGEGVGTDRRREGVVNAWLCDKARLVYYVVLIRGPTPYLHRQKQVLGERYD